MAKLENKAQELEKDGETCHSSTINCDHGESYGYFTPDIRLVLCEQCYDECENAERGQ